MLHGQRCANRQRSSIALCTAHTRGYHPFRKHTGARGVVCVFSSSLVARVLLTFALLYSHLSPLRSLPLPLPHARAPRTARAFFFPFLFRTSFLSFPLRRGGIFVSSYPSSLDLPFPSLPFPISTGRHRKIALKNASFQRDKRRGSSLSDLSPPPPDFARFAIARINIAIATCRGL